MERDTRLTQNESLIEVQLEMFRALCEAPIQAESETTLLSHMNWYGTDIHMSPYGGQERHWAQQRAKRSTENPAVQHLYKTLYGAQDIDTVQKLFAIDLFAWRELNKLVTNYYGPSSPDQYPEDDVFYLDQGYMHTAVTGNDARYSIDWNYYLPGLKVNEEPLIEQRLKDGMPREAQLFGVALMLPGFRGGDHSWSRNNGAAIEGLTRELHLSNAELRTVVALSVRNEMYKKGDAFSGRLLGSVLANDSLRARFTDEDGRFDFATFGGIEALKVAAGNVFGGVIGSNARGNEESAATAIHQWRRLEAIFSEDDLLAALPQAERTKMALSIIVDNTIRGMITHDQISPKIEAMIDMTELAQACWDIFSYFTENPAEIASQKSHRNAPVSRRAEQLDRDGQLGLRADVLRNRERPYLNLLKNVIKYGDTQSDMYLMAAELESEAGAYDPGLLQLLSDYTDLRNDECFAMYSDFLPDDSDETTRWITERAERGKEISLQIEVLIEQIKSEAPGGLSA